MPPIQTGRAGSAAASPRTQRSLDLEIVEAGIAKKLPVLDALSAARRQRTAAGGAPASPTALRLLAQGDSWLDRGPTDLADSLRRDSGHRVTSLAISGSTLDQVAYGTLPLDHLGVAGADHVSRAEDLIYTMQSVRPGALLLSAGGNDVKGGALGLIGSALSSSKGFDAGAVRRHVANAFAQPYRDLVALVTAKAERMGRRVPIVIHGYDYLRVSERARWAAARLGRGAGELLETVGRAFVDAFHDVLSDLAEEHPGTVFLADLRGTLTDAVDWADEIHTSARGFTRLAGKVDGVLRSALAQQAAS
ncbi:hypothetical protein DFR29_1368 [Tahibacter aquaticus]|uniref:GDSL-like lipase/acylhydrolase family protein n=1 Tax=Tahibacter aquaticus TaxID=520092 RepID=A0A4R6YFX1_9GAMM|nr:hypothetical protein [Tahibacter aquaticus]TDR35357.1 hypothetical protein DFR29_1368 [Tahibacter aquaticus]